MHALARLLGVAGKLAMLATTAWSGGKAVATLRHDLRGARTLYAYPAVPAVQNRQEDELHRKLYGDFAATRSPRTPYLCVWRDVGRSVWTGKRSDPPEKIFLTCSFGTGDWQPPAALMEQAEARMRREEAIFRVQWDRDGAGYRMTRFDVEIRDYPNKIDFRSINVDAAVAELRIEQAGTAFPATRDAPFAFKIAVSLPQRRNQGDARAAPTAALTIAGTAEPMPDWIMY